MSIHVGEMHIFCYFYAFCAQNELLMGKSCLPYVSTFYIRNYPMDVDEKVKKLKKFAGEQQKRKIYSIARNIDIDGAYLTER